MEEWPQGTKNGHYSVLAHNMEPLLLLTLLEEGEQEAEVLAPGCKHKGCGTLDREARHTSTQSPFRNMSLLFPARSMLPLHLQPLLLTLLAGGECATKTGSIGYRHNSTQ